ncbi:MAG: metallophosphatase [Hyphomicrobiales bacterium]|nr:MAG: metallophosphatase [Hyphomicrobiales bacterium]
MYSNALKRVDWRDSESAPVVLADTEVLLHPSGALVWPDQKTIVVADLHLEKGSSLASHGMMLPPYDTAATLAALGDVIRQFDPRYIVALGDSFHDSDAASRMPSAYRGELRRLQRNREWIWIAGNHDPLPPEGCEGHYMNEFAVDGFVFRHEPVFGRAPGEVAGHMHPAARVCIRGRSLRRRCFATDGERMILPAFGVFAGGLNVLDRAWASLIQPERLQAYMLGSDRLYRLTAEQLRDD